MDGLDVCVTVIVPRIVIVIDGLTDGECDGLPDIDGDPLSEYVVVCAPV